MHLLFIQVTMIGGRHETTYWYEDHTVQQYTATLFYEVGR